MKTAKYDGGQIAHHVRENRPVFIGPMRCASRSLPAALPAPFDRDRARILLTIPERMPMLKRLGVACLLLGVIACGSSSSSPSAPAPATPTTATVNGVWTGTVTLGSVIGGECFGPSFLTGIGSGGPISLAFTQNASAISAVWTATSGGGNFSYTGTVGQTAVSMTDTACSACNQLGASCPNGAGLRDIKLQSGNFSGATDGKTMSATDSKIYNVFVAGTTNAVGTLTLASTVTLTKQ